MAEFTPIIVKPRSESDAEKVHLFTVEHEDGTETKCMARKVVSKAVTFKALHMMHTKGEMAAQAYCLEAVLGADAYAALMSYELEDDDYTAIMKYTAEVVLGSGKDQPSKNQPASKKDSKK